MPSPAEVAREHAALRRRLAAAAAGEAARLWSQVDPGGIAGSWRSLLPRLLLVLVGAQQAAAARADGYLDEVLDAQGLPVGAAGRVSAAALSGVASDGRELATLLYQPAISALVGIQRGVSVPRALAGGAAGLDMIVRTQVADAGRVADQVATVARDVPGYRRMLVGGSCSRCAVLAGKFFRWNAGFDRHPRCFPAGVTVSGPGSEAATRRWYQGELVVFSTASGKQLPLTGNHPVLTRRGWVPARLLKEGDEVVRSTRPEGATALVVPDHDQVPSRIEDVWRSLGVPILDAVKASPEDFHGDGQDSQVDVVWADGALNGGGLPAFFEHLPESDLTGAAWAAEAFDGEGTTVSLDVRDAALASCLVGLGGLGFTVFAAQQSVAGKAGLAHSAALYAGLGEDARDWPSRHPVLLGQSEFAGSGQIGGDDRLGGKFPALPRWDAPGRTFSVETRDGYAARGLDLLQRLTGQVELDCVVEVRRVEWSGHVYSLTSSEGWHSANSLIVSNCDCVHVPAREDTADDVRTDPKAYFRSLSVDEQDRVFTKAGAEAIRLGADIGQVVNARRGARGLLTAGARVTGDEARMLRGGRDRGRLEAVDVYGHLLFITSEGVTTRGVAGVRLGAKQTGEKQAGGRYRSAKTPRLMPESILAIAGQDRAEAVRLLRRFGYLT